MPRKKQSFGGSFDASFKGFDDVSKKSKKKYDLGDDDPYKFTPDDYSVPVGLGFMIMTASGQDGGVVTIYIVLPKHT